MHGQLCLAAFHHHLPPAAFICSRRSQGSCTPCNNVVSRSFVLPPSFTGKGGRRERCLSGRLCDFCDRHFCDFQLAWRCSLLLLHHLTTLWPLLSSRHFAGAHRACTSASLSAHGEHLAVAPPFHLRLSPHGFHSMAPTSPTPSVTPHRLPAGDAREDCRSHRCLKKLCQGLPRPFTLLKRHQAIPFLPPPPPPLAPPTTPRQLLLPPGLQLHLLLPLSSCSFFDAQLAGPALCILVPTCWATTRMDAPGSYMPSLLDVRLQLRLKTRHSASYHSRCPPTAFCWVCEVLRWQVVVGVAGF